MAAAKKPHSHSKRAQAKRLRARKRGQSKRTQRVTGLAVAAGLGFAVATGGTGLAVAADGDGQSAGPSDTDTTSNTADPDKPNTETEPNTQPPAEPPTPGEESGSQTTTTTGSGPTTTVSSSGGALTSAEYLESEEQSEEPETGAETATETETPLVTTEPVSGEGEPPTTETPTEPQTGAETLAAITEKPVDEFSTLGASVEETGEDGETQEVTVPMQSRMMAMTTTETTETTETTTGILPEYPVVEGVPPAHIAAVVVVVLFQALQASLSGPVPNPIAIPIYFLLVAAYQRLLEVGTNNYLPTATPTTSLVLPTGTVIGNVGAEDLDGDEVSVSLKTGTGPSKGTVVVLADGSYTYTATDLSLINHGGTDTFTVTLDDTGNFAHFIAPNGHTVDQEITVTLPGLGINAPPIPLNSVDSTSPIGVIRGRVKPGDLDDDVHTYSLANGNTAGATATSTYTNLGGIVTLDNATGEYTYVPAVSGNLLGIPTHIDSFTVTVDDGHGAAVQTTVLLGADLGIKVTGASTNPADGAYSGGLNIPPEDAGVLTYSGSTVNPLKGTLTVDADGNFVYKPTAEARHLAAANNAPAGDKVHTFSVYGTDANGRTITVATVDVTINATNLPPTATASQNAPGTNGVVTGGITVLDGDDLTHTFGPQTILTGKGAVTVNPTTGAWSYAPSDVARHAASAIGAPQSAKEVTFSIDVSDEHGGTTSVSVTAPITPKNSPPTVNIGNPVKLLGVATYTPQLLGGGDADGDALTFTITRAPTKGNVLVNLGLGNVISAIIYTSNNPLFPQADNFEVTVSDGHGGTQVVTLNPY